MAFLLLVKQNAGRMTHDASPDFPIVEARNLSVEQHGTLSLRDFSAKLMANDKAVLSGPSGSGKSTLLQVLMGFIPFSGTVNLFGLPLESANIQNIRSRVAYVGQQASLGQGTVNAYVEEVLKALQNRDLNNAYERLIAHFDWLQLPLKTLQKNTSDLSGGEQQRVLLALAMALNRELYLLDEPTASLDIELQHRIIEGLTHQNNTTILIASHDQSWQKAGWQNLPLNHHE